VGLVRTAAATEGRAQLDGIDLWLAPYVASRDPGDLEALQRWFEDEILELPPPAAPWLEHAVQAFDKQLELERSAPPEDAGGDGAAGKLALARAIGIGQGGDGEAGMPRIVSAQLETRLRRRYSPVHVGARLAQLDELMQRLGAELARLQTQADSLAQALAARLWIPPGTCASWLARHAALGAQLQALHARAGAARAGFAELPQRDADPQDQTPVPVQWAGAEECAALT
jgi:MoxR-like ATPase